MDDSSRPSLGVGDSIRPSLGVSLPSPPPPLNRVRDEIQMTIAAYQTLYESRSVVVVVVLVWCGVSGCRRYMWWEWLCSVISVYASVVHSLAVERCVIIILAF